MLGTITVLSRKERNNGENNVPNPSKTSRVVDIPVLRVIFPSEEGRMEVYHQFGRNREIPLVYRHLFNINS